MQPASLVSSGGPFQPYDPENPPSADSIATTTTTDGVTVPFIVRLETGYIDRDQYAIATLFDPSTPWTPTAPQRQLNHRLVITHVRFRPVSSYGTPRQGATAL